MPVLWLCSEPTNHIALPLKLCVLVLLCFDNLNVLISLNRISRIDILRHQPPPFPEAELCLAGSLCEYMVHDMFNVAAGAASQSHHARPGLMAPTRIKVSLSASMALQDSAPGELRGALGRLSYLSDC